MTWRFRMNQVQTPEPQAALPFDVQIRHSCSINPARFPQVVSVSLTVTHSMGSRAAAFRLAELARVCRTQGTQPTPAALAPLAKLFDGFGQPSNSNVQLRTSVLPAQDEYYEQEPSGYVHETRVDDFGAVSRISENELEYQPNLYRNIDGHRNEDGRYAAFTNEITAFIPKERQYTDPVRTFAYGTDASFYR